MRLLLAVLFLFSLNINGNAQQVESETPKASFGQKVRFGGNVGFSFGDYTSVQLAPSAVYSLTDKLDIGLGVSYMYEKDDYFKSHVFGGRLISLFRPIDFLQLSAEYEQMKINREWELEGATKSKQDYWQPAIYLGVSYVNQGFYIGLRYDVLYDKDKSIYSNAFTPYLGIYI